MYREKTGSIVSQSTRPSFREILTDSRSSFTPKQHVANRENRHQWYAKISQKKNSLFFFDFSPLFSPVFFSKVASFWRDFLTAF